MKDQIIGSLTKIRTHYSQHDKYGIKLVALNDSTFTKKVRAEFTMKRITGLEYVVPSDTKFAYKKKRHYGSLYQKLDVERGLVYYQNMVG